MMKQDYKQGSPPSASDTYLVYMDDSRDEQLCVFSALVIPVSQWREIFARVREFRRALRKSDGLYIYEELHACEFVAGRGRPSPNDRPIFKGRRCQIFKETLAFVASLPNVWLFNAV